MPQNAPSLPNSQPDKKPNPLTRWSWWAAFAALLVANYVIVSMFTPNTSTPRTEISYTFFRQQVSVGNVVEISSQGDAVQGTFRQPETYPPEGGAAATAVTDFSTQLPAFADPGLETLLDQQGVTINAKPISQAGNPLVSILLSFGPTLLLIGGFLWIS